jgi:urocanate hydratase
MSSDTYVYYKIVTEHYTAHFKIVSRDTNDGVSIVDAINKNLDSLKDKGTEYTFSFTAFTADELDGHVLYGYRDLVDILVEEILGLDPEIGYWKQTAV